MNYTRVIKTT